MSWTHLEDSTPKARKDYQCLLCERMIHKGEKHVRRAGVNEDGKTSFRMHSACSELASGWDEDHWERHDAQDFREELDASGLPGAPPPEDDETDDDRLIGGKP